MELKVWLDFILLSIKKVFLVGIFVVERCWEEDSNDFMAFVRRVKSLTFFFCWLEYCLTKERSVRPCQWLLIWKRILVSAFSPTSPPPPASSSLEMHTPSPLCIVFIGNAYIELKTLSRVETLQAEAPWTATSSPGSSPRRFSIDAILKSKEDPEEWGGGWRAQWKRSLWSASSLRVCMRKLWLICHFLVTYLPSNVLLWTRSSFPAFSEREICYWKLFSCEINSSHWILFDDRERKETHLCVHVRRRILTNAHEH